MRYWLTTALLVGLLVGTSGIAIADTTQPGEMTADIQTADSFEQVDPVSPDDCQGPPAVTDGDVAVSPDCGGSYPIDWE